MVGHRMMGISFITGDIAQSRVHYDQAIVLYDPAEHRPLAIRFGQMSRWQSCPIVRWRCGCLVIPGRVRRRRDAIREAREIGQAATLMLALYYDL